MAGNHQDEGENPLRPIPGNFSGYDLDPLLRKVRYLSWKPDRFSPKYRLEKAGVWSRGGYALELLHATCFGRVPLIIAFLTCCLHLDPEFQVEPTLQQTILAKRGPGVLINLGFT